MGDYTPPPAQLDDSAVHLEVVDRDGQQGQAPVVDIPDVIADIDLDDLTGDGDGSDDDVVDLDDVVDIGR